MSPTLCLNMIVKNESNIIERLLSSVVDIIDCYCICDTGSDDNTIEIITKFFEKHNKPGKIVEKPFNNFCVNRNYAIQQAIHMAEYLIFLDADMMLNVSNNFSKDTLTSDFYHIKQYTNSGFFYYNVRIASTKCNPKYYGVTHEYLSTDNFNKDTLNTLNIYDINDGGCKENKFLRDIQLLSEGLKQEPTNARYMFYLANSYRDTSQLDKAIEYYTERIKLGGWEEEIHNSMYNIGICYKRKKDNAAFVYCMIEAWNYRPTRIEPLFHIIEHYVYERKYQIAKIYYDLAKNITIPTDILFIEGDMYGHKLDYLYTLMACYCKNTENVYKCFESLFKNPKYNLDKLLGNYNVYVPILDEIQYIDISCSHTFEINGKNTLLYGGNPSIIQYKNGYIVNMSLINSREESNTNTHTYNKCLTLDKQFNIQKFTFFDNNKHPKNGIENIILTKKGEQILFTGNMKNLDNTFELCYGKYNICDTVLNANPIQYTEEIMKDISFIPDTKEYIYKWFPLSTCKMVKKSNNNFKLVKNIEKTMPTFFHLATGSGPGFRYNDEIWFVVRYVNPNDNPVNYSFNCIVVLDNSYNCKWYSYPFKLLNKSADISQGVIVEKDNLIFTHSHDDSRSRISIIDKSTFITKYKIVP